MNTLERDEDQPRDPAIGVPRREIGEDGVRRVLSPSSGAGMSSQLVEPEDTLRLGIPKRDRVVSSAVSDVPLASDDRLFNGDDLADEETAPTTARARRRIFLVANVLIVVVGGLGVVLLLVGEFPNWWSSFDSLPSVYRWAGRSGIVLIAVVASLATAQFAVLVWRLRVTPSISRDALDLLEARAGTRQLARTESLRGRSLIEQFLAAYPLHESNWSRLRRLGFDEGIHIRPLREQLDQLVEARGGTTRQWLKDVDEHFLGKLDEVAAIQVSQCSTRVGFLTAAARSGLLDTAIIVINMLQLVRVLCEIYNVRPTKWATVRIATRMFVSAIVAEHLEQVGDQLGTSIADALHDHIGALVANALGTASGRISEGVANALMIRRLGFATVGHLRPIRKGR